MTALVCKGCWTAYRLPAGDVPPCPRCGGDEYRLEHRDRDDQVEYFDQKLRVPTFGPDRENADD